MSENTSVKSVKAVFKVAFTPDKMVDAKKDFRGTIVDAEYGLTPFGFKGKADFEAREQLAIKIRTEAYEKDQISWFPPSDKKLTKWAYLIGALADTGALKDIVVKGETNEENMQSFAKSLIGMDFQWVEGIDLPSAARNKVVDILLPTKYYGKEDISPMTDIKEENLEL